MRILYILDKDHNPIRCDTLEEWREWWKDADMVLARTFVGKYRVVTWFFGVCTKDLDDPKPFFTATFTGNGLRMVGEGIHSRSFGEAIAEHAERVAKIESALGG